VVLFRKGLKDLALELAQVLAQLLAQLVRKGFLELVPE